ncbi:MAG: hypothetical protein HEQ23_04130 [Tepidisphaera sp.]
MRPNPRRAGLVSLLWFSTLLLFFVVVNYIGATLLVLPRFAVGPSPKVTDLDPELRWPSWTPVPWPTPKSVYTETTFGRKSYNAFGPAPDKPGVNSFQMQAAEYGWPMPVIVHSQRWWDWGNPSLVPPGKTANELNDLQVEIKPFGLIIPAIGAAGLVWLPTAGLWLFVRHRRAQRKRCVECGYPAGAAPVCTECGSAFDQAVTR